MYLKNETVIITGGTSGIGRQLTEILLNEGCKVAICSRNQANVDKVLKELKVKFPDSIIGKSCDVSTPDSLKEFMQYVKESLGSVRILIANAGINLRYGPFACMPLEMVNVIAKETLDVNLIGVMNTIASVLPIMQEQKYGRIITLAGAGVDRPIDNMTIYSASKGGVLTFSKCLALELAQNTNADIKLNIFQPGMLKTKLTTTVECVPNWKTEQEILQEVELVLDYLGGDIEKSCKKVISYILPSTKHTGKVFRGFSLFKLIIQAIKLQTVMKKRKRRK